MQKKKNTWLLINPAEFHKCDERGKKGKKRDRLLKADALVDLYNCCLLPFLWFPFQSVSQSVSQDRERVWGFQPGPSGRTDGRTGTHSEAGRQTKRRSRWWEEPESSDGTESQAGFVLSTSDPDGFHWPCHRWRLKSTDLMVTTIQN